MKNIIICTVLLIGLVLYAYDPMPVQPTPDKFFGTSTIPSQSYRGEIRLAVIFGTYADFSGPQKYKMEIGDIDTTTIQPTFETVDAVTGQTINYTGTKFDPALFTMPDGSSSYDYLQQGKYIGYRTMTNEAIRDYIYEMSYHKITVVVDTIKNPNRPDGFFVIGNYSSYLTGPNNTLKPGDMSTIQTAIEAQAHLITGYNSSNYNRRLIFAHPIPYPHNPNSFGGLSTGFAFIYDRAFNPGSALHEIGHNFFSIGDKGYSMDVPWFKGKMNGTNMGVTVSLTSPYDMMNHNGGSGGGPYMLYGLTPFHTADLIKSGFIDADKVLTIPNTQGRYVTRIKAVRKMLGDTDLANGIKHAIKITVLGDLSEVEDRSYQYKYSNATGLVEKQHFLIEYRDGSGFDRLSPMYQPDQSKGILISHVIDDDSYSPIIDIEIAKPYPYLGLFGETGVRNPVDFAPYGRDYYHTDAPAPWNGNLYHGKPDTDWLDDILFYKQCQDIVGNPIKARGGRGANWKCPAFEWGSSSPTDFFVDNDPTRNKFTPSTKPSTISWKLQDTHIGVYIQSISGEYADIAVYRNYWSRPLTEATTTINQNCFFGENFTVAAGQILEIGNNLTACVVEKGTFTVKSGATLKIGSNSDLIIENLCNFILEPGATVEMGENSSINANTQANIYAVGTLNQPITIRNPRTGTLWSGISSGYTGFTNGPNGDINLEYCNIIGMLNGISGSPSLAAISNCNFNSVGVAINFANCNKATISDNNFYGRDAFNTAITLTQSFGRIERNQITGFGTGIKVVSSSPNIVSNNIFGNAICGLTSDGINGKPVVTRNNIYNNGNTATGQKSQIEIYETSNVYLANGNNNIYGALNSSGTPLVPCISRISTAAARALNATGNYWGSSSVNNSFFKPVNGSWINYSPYSATAYNNKSSGEATPENLLLTAGLAAQKSGDLATAENSFSNLITKFADTPESYQAAAALLENYLHGNKDLNKLLTQYAALGASSSWTDSRFFAEMTFKTLLSQQNTTAAFAKATELFNSAANDREKILARIDQFLSASSDNKAQNLGNTNLNALLIMLDNGKFTDLAGETLNNNLPANYRLYNSYPNPFNPSTTIKFDLPVNSLVKLAVYDVAGRQVAVLANGMLNGGTHTMEFNGAKLASGVYFYQLEAEGKIIGRNKMMLLK